MEKARSRCACRAASTIPTPSIQRPVFHDETKKCDKCNGKKTERSSDEDIKRLVSNLVQSIATLNLNDKRAQASLSEGYTVLDQNDHRR